MVSRPLLAVALGAAAAAAVLAFYVTGHQVNPFDVQLARAIQATGWGPLQETFGFFAWIGDAKGAAVDAAVLVLVLIVNRREWLFAALAPLTAGWYEVVSHLVIRKRPSVPDVLHVTEHPPGSSFPSGHTMFQVTVVTVLMLCLGRRFLPRWAQPLGWAVAVLVVVANCIARVYTGAHWPTDVFGGIVIAVAWLALLASFRPRVVRTSP